MLIRRVLVTLPLSDAELAPLRARPGLEVRVVHPAALGPSDLSWAHAVLGNVSIALLAGAGQLLLLHSPNVGLEQYAGLDRSRPELRVTHSVGVMDAAVAEHAVALLLAMSRRLPFLLEQQASRLWGRDRYINAGSVVLAGRHAHVLGFGRIAQAVLTRLHALGLRSTVYRRSPHGHHAAVEQFRSISEVPEHIGGADVIVCVLPDRPQTRRLLDGQVLGSVKPGAFLVNVGRGSVLDEAALAAALHGGRLAGAALDVFESEPLPADSPLWDAPNVLISPHVAGRFAGEMGQHVEQFLQALEASQRPVHVH